MPLDFSCCSALYSASCRGQNCIAAGSYNNAMSSVSLLATSNDAGLTWRYTIDSTTPVLPLDFSSNAYFSGASCNGQQCIAAGTYQSVTSYYPLLASSTDGGSTWTYAIDSSKPLFPANYDHDGMFYPSPHKTWPFMARM